MPDSYPNHAPLHSLPPIPHPGCFGGACRGPLESLVEVCICLVCPASNRCCLPTPSRRRVGPLLEVQLIQQYTTSKLQIICESYPRIIPPNHTPNHTLESYHLFKLPGPSTVKKYTPMCCDMRSVCSMSYVYLCVVSMRIELCNLCKRKASKSTGWALLVQTLSG